MKVIVNLNNGIGLKMNVNMEHKTRTLKLTIEDNSFVKQTEEFSIDGNCELCQENDYDIGKFLTKMAHEIKANHDKKLYAKHITEDLKLTLTIRPDVNACGYILGWHTEINGHLNNIDTKNYKL